MLERIQVTFTCLICQELVWQAITTPCLHNICKVSIMKGFTIILCGFERIGYTQVWFPIGASHMTQEEHVVGSGNLSSSLSVARDHDIV